MNSKLFFKEAEQSFMNEIFDNYRTVIIIVDCLWPMLLVTAIQLINDAWE